MSKKKIEVELDDRVIEAIEKHYPSLEYGITSCVKTWLHTKSELTADLIYMFPKNKFMCIIEYLCIFSTLHFNLGEDRYPENLYQEMFSYYMDGVYDTIEEELMKKWDLWDLDAKSIHQEILDLPYSEEALLVELRLLYITLNEEEKKTFYEDYISENKKYKYFK